MHSIELTTSNQLHSTREWSPPSAIAAIQRASEPIATAFFLLGSYLTDPICKVHELGRSMQVLRDVHRHASNWKLAIFKAAMIADMLFFAVAAIITAPLGAICRKVGMQLQEKPFLYIRGDAREKVLSDRSFTLYSANICCVAGGYTISDGGVTPWPQRIDRLAQKILEQDADIASLQETFDSKSWMHLVNALKDRYAHFYVNIGGGALTGSSGLFIASKYEIQNTKFVPFPKNSLIGSTKFCNKGFFTIDACSNGKPFATVISTHAQHSEQPEFPARKEVAGRTIQMQRLADQAKSTPKGRAVIVTGDLNLGECELAHSALGENFTKTTFSGPQKSYPGDHFCAKLAGGGKKASGALNLDHTLLLEQTAESIDSHLVDMHYDPSTYTPAALSDHCGLFSTVMVKQRQSSPFQTARSGACCPSAP